MFGTVCSFVLGFGSGRAGFYSSGIGCLFCYLGSFLGVFGEELRFSCFEIRFRFFVNIVWFGVSY